MEILQTQGQIASAQFPTKLEVLRELEKRGVPDADYNYLEKGFQGEQWVLDKISDFGANHWKVLRNLWLEHNGRFECDLLVLTPAGIYTMEIKNYSGHFEFKNALCYLNGKKIGHNAIYQAQKSTVSLENLIQEEFPRANVQGALIFVGEHNTVDVQDQVDDIQIVMRNQIRNHIWKMLNDERNLQGPGLDIDASVQWLEQFEVNNPFQPEPISPENLVKLRKGICCSHCGSFDVDTSKSNITCSCGMHEPRENAIVRTICEYGVIHFDKNLKTTEVSDFFDGQVSRTTILALLNKHFTKIGSNKSTEYISKRLPINKLYDLFNFEKHRIQKLEGY